MDSERHLGGQGFIVLPWSACITCTKVYVLGAQLRQLLSEDFRSLDDFRAADRARHPVRACAGLGLYGWKHFRQ